MSNHTPPKVSDYIPLLSIMLTMAVLVITATWAISELHTVNMVQDERISRVEANQSQDESRNEARFDKLDNKVDAGFSKTYDLIMQIKQEREGPNV